MGKKAKLQSKHVLSEADLKTGIVHRLENSLRVEQVQSSCTQVQTKDTPTQTRGDTADAG